ncbi:hypothetical protein FGIG_04964 [Fasciola gigantica]|uniref:Uncharacterized protein n=1 Tax=Fasciola gigantica TaxID=46835 RepID=A0A504Y5A5_FASGI|nr:hypothetical protein FGIG_04964 [Fasciola gigantica]
MQKIRMAKSGGLEVPLSNYVAKDRIWQVDSCSPNFSGETIVLERISPEELLKDELHLLKDPNRKRPEVPRHLKVNEADSPSTYIHVLPSPKPFPPTTSGEIGWRSGKEQYKLDKYNQQRAPQGNILLKFGWPIEATW